MDSSVPQQRFINKETAHESTDSPIESTLYPKILKLRDFLYATKDFTPLTSVHLTGSVKLHGTHADIVFSSNSNDIRLQSTTQLALEPGPGDNCGFAAFVAAIDKTVLSNLRITIIERWKELNPGKKIIGDIVVAGEWCGEGVQKNVAISRVAKVLQLSQSTLTENGFLIGSSRISAKRRPEFFHVGKAGFYEHELLFHEIDASKATITHLTDPSREGVSFRENTGRKWPR